MKLGSRIVNELNIHQSSDTLSRWMAHHLAEVIKEAETAEGTERESLQEKAVCLILELWSNRKNLPGNAYPLNHLKDIISILILLRKSSSPFSGHGHGKIEKLFSSIFSSLQVIVIHGTVLTAKAGKLPEDIDSEKNFLDADENRVLNAVKEWENFIDDRHPMPQVLIQTEQSTSDFGQIQSNIAKLEAMDPVERSKFVLHAEIEGIMKTLTELKEILED